MAPWWSFYANLATLLIVVCALLSLVNTALMSPPFYMEMTLNWSSSFTQMRKVLALLMKIPLESGQSLLSPAASRYLSPSLKRKWSAIIYCWTSLLILPSGWYSPAISPSNLVKALTASSSTFLRWSLEILVPKGKSARLRANLIRVDTQYLSSKGSKLHFEASQSEICLSVGLWPW